MARGFFASMNRIARDAEMAQRRRQREQERAIRERERYERAQIRRMKMQTDASGMALAQEENQRLEAQLNALSSILRQGLRDPGINFEDLYKRVNESDLDARQDLTLPPVPNERKFEPDPPGFFGRLFGMRRYEETLAIGKKQYRLAVAAYDAVKQRRRDALDEMTREAEAHNKNINEYKQKLDAGDQDAVIAFYEMVFDKSVYPAGFPTEYNIAYSNKSKMLLVETRLPTMDDIVPTAEKYRYVKASKELAETKKSEKVRQSIYTSAITQTVLRTAFEAFEARLKNIDLVTVNAFVDTVDPSTGQNIKPCLISLRVSRDELGTLDLRNVDPVACLKRLHASVSRSPAELVAVRPIIEFNMYDPRFIKEQDILSTLDQRPNLMELTPSEFESLITNLFQKMGLDTKLTQASRDGGVDCVAYDPRPVLGGKVIVQAKRYKNTVGVSSVRDLFGTVHNEGAAKGILVTTSGYGKAAYDFANGKPLELITGSNLLYMLKEYSGIDAKIEVPDGWVDMPPD